MRLRLRFNELSLGSYELFDNDTRFSMRAGIAGGLYTV